MEPMRPSGVPSEAVWNKKDNEWQLGESLVKGKVKKENVPVGTWKYWSRDGYLICVADFDNEGGLTGVLERYHPDGSLASRGEYQKGNRHGHFVYQRSHIETPESYPADYGTWRYEFDAFNNWEEKAIRYFLEDGRECTADGRPLDSAFDLDELISKAEPENYLSSYAQVISSSFADTNELLDDPLKLEDLWGCRVEEIDKLVSFAIEGDSYEPCHSRREFHENIWLSLIEYPFDNYREELAAVFMGAVKIGNFGDSDGVYATLFQPKREKPGANAVYLWSHDTYYIDEVLADSLDTFAFRMALACAHEAQRISPAVTLLSWNKLQGKVYVNWGLASGLDDVCEDADMDEVLDRDEFHADLDPKNHLRGNFWRAQWIIELLNEEPAKKISSAKECFRPGFNKAIDDHNHRVRIDWGLKLPHSAIYLLWRYFWFAQHDRLVDCKNAFREHRASIVRDLVSLLDEIEHGRTELGGIKDILALREEFLKLDLCPEDSERRESESKLLQLEKSKVINHVSVEADLFGDDEMEPFLDFVFSKMGDPQLVKSLEPRARRFPGMQMHWRILDWVRDAGYERANQDNLDEVKTLAEWLGQNQSSLIEPFIWNDLFTDERRAAFLLLPHLCKIENCIDRRFRDLALHQLDVPEEYRHIQCLALMLLRALNARDCLERLLQSLDSFFKDLEDKVDFEARMAMIPWEDFLVELCLTLEKFADIECADAARVRSCLVKLVSVSAGNYSYKVCAAASKSLFAWGERDIMGAARRLISDNDDASRVVAYSLIERAAAFMSKEQRQDIIDSGFFNPDEDSNSVTLMYYRAYHALAAGLESAHVEPELLPMSQVMDLCSDLSSYGSDRWAEWRRLEIETYGNFAELDLENIRHYLDHPDVELRKAAVAAFRKRGNDVSAKKTISWIDRWNLEDKQSGNLSEWISDCLVSDEIPDKKLLASWAWEQASVSCDEALAGCALRRLESFVAPGAGEDISMELFWILRAVARHAAYGSCREVLFRLLSNPDEHLVSPILSELDKLDDGFAQTLVKCAVGMSGWRKADIAQWLLARDGSPIVEEALKKAGLTQKKVKSWTR